jgi:hypothetical protein
MKNNGGVILTLSGAKRKDLLFSCALNDIASPGKQQMLRFVQHDPRTDGAFFLTFVARNSAAGSGQALPRPPHRRASGSFRTEVGGVCIFGLLLLSCLLLSAQNSVTSLRGTIADAQGAVVPAAVVTLENRENGFVQTRTADGKGNYEFLQIPAGKYTITATATGFAKASRPAALLVNQPATINFSLSVRALATTLEVSSDLPALNLVDASLGNAVDNATVQALPMEGRNVPDLLSLQPGVVYLGLTDDQQSRDSRSGASAGARSDQGNITLDGVDNNDQVRGYAFTGVLRSTLDSVEEFRVTTAGFNADTGRSSGAQVSIVTKSGSNQVHGSLYEYNRNTALAANDWFNKQAELAQGLPNLPGKLIRNTYGASLGGPIKKNKLFYFVNYEGQKTAENVQQTTIVPTASLRAGQLRYPAAGGGQIVTLNSAQIASMDPDCSGQGTCPWGAGIDPYSVAVFNQYPLPNGHAAGDGLNTASYTWSAPNPGSLNTFIVKLDANVSSHNWLFVRGNLQNDRNQAPPEFPGQPPSSTNTDNSKGIAAGDTWNISPRLVNDLRYGFTRQGYGERGIGQGQYANFYDIGNLYAETRTTLVGIPVHNLVDDLTWIRNRHTFQFGVNCRLVHNHNGSDALSYASGLTNSQALANAGIAGLGTSLDPAAFGFPTVDSSFTSAYNYAAANLVGLLDEVTSQYNYQVSADGKTASLLPPGAFLNRDFKDNEFEYYLQDSWRMRPNLTVSLGLRHTLLQTPYEVNGQQVQPTTDMWDWFMTRGEQAALGNTVQPDLAFAPSGQARGLKPYWPMQKNNLAPRISFAYSPSPRSGLLRKLLGDQGRSSLRAGYGIYYDHYGQSIVSLFDQYGSFGLSESLMNPLNTLTPDTSPRFTGLHNLPDLTGTPAGMIDYPAVAPTDPLTTGFAISRGLDDRMQTPYAHVATVSIQRELPGKLVFEAAYLGRFGRHMLQQLDLAQPLDLVDPVSGRSYFSAAAELSQLGYAGAAAVPAIPFFEDMFPWMAGGGNSATQNIYNNIWKYVLGNETAALYELDILGCSYGGYNGKMNRFWSSQYSSLYAWSSIGRSNYNAGQFTLRRAMGHGFQFDFSYTYGKSLDMGSDTERSMYSIGTNIPGSAFGAILNAWNPQENYAPSDFDVRHVIAASGVFELPVGQGKAIGSALSPRMNSIVGGWQLSGLGRWTGGLPFSVISGAGWSTNWDEMSAMVQTGPIATGTYIGPNGEPEAFANPAQALANLRNPYPGEAGQRNNFRGPGYFGIDASLSKTWKVRERNSLKFAWEVFNVTNSVRFDVNPLTSLQNVTSSGEFGAYDATLTKPRVQQLSLRFSF